MVFSDNGDLDTPPRSPPVDDEDIEYIEVDEEELYFIQQPAEGNVEVLQGEEGGVLGEEDDTDMEINELAPTLASFTCKDVALRCDFQPTNENIIACGGMDDCAYVLSHSNDGNQCTVIKSFNFSETVDSVNFSPCGKYLGVADCTGNLKVFDTAEWNCIISQELDDDFQKIVWHPTAPVMVAILKNYTIMLNMVTLQTKSIAGPTLGEFVGGQIFPDGRRMVVVTNTGNVSIIDLKTTEMVKSTLLKVPNGQNCVVINTFDVNLDGTNILCGGDEGSILSFTAELGKINFLSPPNPEMDKVEVVAYAPTVLHKNLAATLNLNGVIRFWDTSKLALRCQCETGITGTFMKWHQKEPILFTTHYSGITLMVDGLTGNLVKSFQCHYEPIYCFAISNTGNLFATCSEDHNVRIFSVQNESE